jgi:fatty-acyl-CoA synthase
VRAKAIVLQGDQLSVAGYRSLAGIHVLSDAQLDPAHTQHAIRSGPDDLALIQFTSGTAGDPKAVLLSQRALFVQCELLRNHLALYDRFVERGVSWLPLFHDMGLIGFLLTPGFAGGEVNLLQPEDFILRPSLWLQAITEVKATITGAPPSAYALCARRVKDADAGQYDLSSVRAALVGAEQVTPESIASFCDKFRAAGFRRSALLPTYGLAENALAVTMPPLESGPQFDAVDGRALAEGVARAIGGGGPANERQFASVGLPLPGMSVRIVGQAGRELPERHVGEIVIQGPSMMAGYLAGGAMARQVISDGWLYTGDLGYMANGRLHVTGRKKEIIIVGGRSYYPNDVEQVVAGVEGVRMDRAVAGDRRRRLGARDRETDRTRRNRSRRAGRPLGAAYEYPAGPDRCGLSDRRNCPPAAEVNTIYADRQTQAQRL